MPTFCSYQYPSNSGPTATWVPSIAPVSPGSERTVDLGWLSHLMPDGQTQFNYRIRPRIDLWTLEWRVLLDADLDSFITFVDAIGEAGAFSMVAPVTRGTFFKVKFDGNPMLGWKSISPGLWSVIQKLRAST